MVVKKRKLAVPETTAFICTLSKGTQDIIRDDLEAYAKEHKFTLEWDREAGDYVAMTRRFCDIDEIYNSTDLEFCNEGEDLDVYEKGQKREITLKLKDKDVEELCRTSGKVGLSVSELLESFIGDLIHGDRTNGSDERMLANKWFERCWFSTDMNLNFLSYLLEGDDVDRVLYLWKCLEDYKQSAELDEDELEEQTWIQEELDQIYQCYRECRVDYSEKLGEEMKKVLEWEGERDKIMKRNESYPTKKR